MRAGLIAIPKDPADIASIVRHLQAAGLPASAVTVVGPNPSDAQEVPALAEAVEPGTVNEMLGAVVGGGLGLLGGIALLSVPGIGPLILAGGIGIVAVENVATAVAGATLGAAITARADLATVAHHEALFQRELAAGRWLVLVSGEPEDMRQAERCLANYELQHLDKI